MTGVTRRSGFFGIILLVVLLTTGAFLALRVVVGARAPDLGLGGRIAVLPIVGVIESERTFVERLERFRDDRTVSGFLVEIRSPGGAAAPSQAIYESLRALRASDDRPVVSWIGTVGASGGYYAALPADSILALPSAITGSIGVIMTWPNANELMRRWGIEFEVVKSGENKGLGGWFDTLEPAEREILQTLIDDTHGQFVDAVATSRPLSRDSILALADGRIMSGERAADVGLIDRTGTMEDALAMVGRMAGLGDTPRVVRPAPPRMSFLEWLSQGRVSLPWSGLDLDLPALPAPSTTPSLRFEWR